MMHTILKLCEGFELLIAGTSNVSLAGSTTAAVLLSSVVSSGTDKWLLAT